MYTHLYTKLCCLYRQSDAMRIGCKQLQDVWQRAGRCGKGGGGRGRGGGRGLWEEGRDYILILGFMYMYPPKHDVHICNLARWQSDTNSQGLCGLKGCC